MKLLHFADLHLDTPFAWASAEVGTRRRQALRDTLREICRVAVERNVDALTCGGDLYEQERFTPDTAQFIANTFAQLAPLPVLIAPGNHDWLAPRSIYETTRWSSNVHVFKSDRLESHVIDGVTIWGGAHRAPANTDDFLRNFRATAPGVNIGLFHASERGAFPTQASGKEPHAAFSVHEIRDAGLAHALLGHYHTPIDRPDFTYPGSPEPLAFGEGTTGSVVLFEVQEDGIIATERIRVAQTEYAELSLDVSGATSAQDVIEAVRSTLTGLSGMARIAIHGEVDPDLSISSAQLTQVNHALEYVQFDLRGLRPAYRLEVIGGEQTVRGQFVRDVMGSELDEDEKRRVMITGLRALAGRTDLEVAT